MQRKPDCRVCLMEHDDEIHAATLNVHDWFHELVTQGFHEDGPVGLPIDIPFDLPADPAGDPEAEPLTVVSCPA
jgi:hypothetical protein